jgi:hypothetical protein
LTPDLFSVRIVAAAEIAVEGTMLPKNASPIPELIGGSAFDIDTVDPSLWRRPDARACKSTDSFWEKTKTGKGLS